MYKYVIMKVSQKGKVTDRRTYTLTHTDLLLDLGGKNSFELSEKIFKCRRIECHK